MQRRKFHTSLLSAGALLATRQLRAQPKGVPRIGYLNLLSAHNAGSSIAAFQAGLADLGYVVGKNIEVDYRFADSDFSRIPQLAADLVARKPDVLVSFANGVVALSKLTTSIPIVMAAYVDPLAAGLVSNLAKPGGNVTGLTFFSGELASKRVELLKEMQQRVGKVAMMVVNIPDPWQVGVRQSAELLKLELEFLQVRTPAEFAPTFERMVRTGVRGLVVTDHALFVGNADALARLAAKHRLPAVVPFDVTELGFPVGYGVEYSQLFYRAAGYVHRILGGARPAEMPVERPTRFMLGVNLGAARAIDVQIPEAIMVRADKVFS